MKRKCAILVLMVVLAALVSAAGGPEREATGAGAGRSSPANLNISGYPVVEEKITLKMMGSKHPFHINWEDMFFFKDMEERTNIHFEFDTPPSATFKEKLYLAFSSGDLPDVLLGANLTPTEEIQFGSQGFLVPLEDLIKQYGPNTMDMFAQNPDVKKAITTPEGHIYALPDVVKVSIAQASSMWVNGEWLQNLGVTKLPETVDQLRDLLRRFRDDDPNSNGRKDEIPLTSNRLNDIRTPILAAFGLLSNSAEVHGDTVVFAPIQPNYKEYIAYMKSLWDEQLLDPDTFSQNIQQMGAKGKENRVGMFQHAVPSIVFREDSVIHPILPVMTSSVNTEKVYPIQPAIFRGGFAITSRNRHPEAMTRWVDYLYTVEGSILIHYSVAGNYWEWADEAKTIRKNIPPPPGLALGQLRGQFTPAPANVIPKWSRVEVEKSFRNDFNDHRYKETDEKLMPYGRMPFPLTYNTVEENNRLRILLTDISSYVDQMEAKFVTGQVSLSQWDDYVAAIKKMGVDELVSIQQTAYDRWKALP